MPRERRSRQRYTAEQICARVTHVMEDAGSYPGFATLLSVLMVANNELGDLPFARLYQARTGHPLSRDAVRRFRTGEERPPYRFVADLLDYNLLNFDPGRTCPAHGDQRAGPDREALFTAAGLTEVTSESVRAWNRAVIGQLRQSEGNAPLSGPSWVEIMRQLIAFHTDGGRITFQKVAAAAVAYCGKPTDNQASRLLHVLYGTIVSPHAVERQALYRFAGLDAGQIGYLEAGVEEGRFSLLEAGQRSSFANLLSATLDKLRERGVTAAQLSLGTGTMGADGGLSLSPSQLSAWRHGKRGSPTLESLRTLAMLLRPFCGPGKALGASEVDRLIEAAGFSAADLATTSHDVIASSDGTTQIKPLLRAIRIATDISSPAAAAAGDEPGPRGGATYPGENAIREWERPGGRCPSAEQVRKLLARYNQILESKRLPPLTEEEVRKVAEVAERDYSRWLESPHAEKASGGNAQRPRNPLSPSLETEPSDRGRG